MTETVQGIIEESENLQQNDFTAHFRLTKELADALEKYPEQAENLLPALANLSETKIRDVWHEVKRTFISFAKHLPAEKIMSFTDSLSKNGQKLMLSGNISELISVHSQTSGWLFNKFKELSLHAGNNEISECCRNLMNVISAAETKEARQMLNEAVTLPKPAKDGVYALLGKTGADRADLRPQIRKILSDYEPQTGTELLHLHDCLAKLAAADTGNEDFYLQVTAKLLDNKNCDTASLQAAYKTLAIIRRPVVPVPPELSSAGELPAVISENTNFMNKVDKVLEYGLTLQQNDENSRKAAYRAMEKLEELYSSVSIGQRVKKDSESPFGWKKPAVFDAEETCVLFLGGDGTVSAKGANGYLKSTEELLIRRGMGGIRDKIGLYSIVYDFGSFEDRGYIFDRNDARTMLMQKYHRSVKPKNEHISPDTVNPRYIKQIFDRIFLPRLTDEKGERLAFPEARRRIRRLNIIAHCHGAYTFLKLEEMMQKKMKDLGYGKTESAAIQKQLLCTAIAPYCPLGVSKSTMISFCSAKDDEVSHHNHFQREVRKLAEENKLKLSYFSQEKGEFFLTPSFGGEEHNFTGFDMMNGNLDRDGSTTVYFMGNVIINGIKSSLNDTPLPEVRNLLCSGDRKNEQMFDAILKNGENTYAEISSRAKKITRNTHEIAKAQKKLRKDINADGFEKMLELLGQNNMR